MQNTHLCIRNTWLSISIVTDCLQDAWLKGSDMKRMRYLLFDRGKSQQTFNGIRVDEMEYESEMFCSVDNGGQNAFF